jgi:hypothetical protein
MSSDQFDRMATEIAQALSDRRPFRSWSDVLADARAVLTVLAAHGWGPARQEATERDREASA